MTYNIYNILQQATQLSREETILEAILENYTPTMIGDFNNKVVEETSGGSIIVLADPTKAIIGKARWLLRVLIATAGHAKNHEEAETWPGKITVLENGKLKAKLGLVQLAFGSTNPAWQGLYKIHAKLEIIGTGDPRDPVYGRSYRGVARPRLMTMGKDKEKVKLITPLAPGRLRLHVRIVRRRLPADADIKGINLNSLDALIASVVLAVFRLLGVGAGANRGFGRFHAVKVTSKYASEIPAILREQARQTQYNIKNIRSTIIKLVELTVASVPGATRAPATPKEIPIIDINNIRVYLLTGFLVNKLQEKYRKLPGQKHSRLQYYRGVHRALEIIAMATLKVTWKILNREGRSGGGAYHTWILGLPRSQKPNIRDICFHHNRKIKLLTGYMLRGRRGLGSEKQLKRLNNKNRAYITASKEDKDFEVFEEARRQSSFVFFPLDANGIYIALIPMFPSDFNDIIVDLHHFGGYVNPRSKRPVFVDAVRVAGVAEIASRGIPRDLVRCGKKEYVNDAVLGVARPHSVTHPGKPGSPAPLVGEDKLVGAAYSAALEFFDSLLS